ncbi:MAG TPA: type II toxin-antitoxin system HicB family antitoxin [Candidatus Deferrimicrobium sp.]|nr:type II toxin-antitoxin system HicB family antitoxin [Candidatus Deferrimicrobium sp.]
MKRTFTAIYEKIEEVYIGYVEEVPGVNSQGNSLEEVRANLSEALDMVLLANKDLTEKKISWYKCDSGKD